MADEKKVAPVAEEKKPVAKKAVKAEKKEPEVKPYITRPVIDKDYGILKYQIVSEQTQALQDKDNALVFAVSKTATKMEIKAAIEALFQAKVKNVNTQNKTGKNRRVGKYSGKLPDYKKATVRFDASFNIGKIQNALASEEMKSNEAPVEDKKAK